MIPLAHNGLRRFVSTYCSPARPSRVESRGMLIAGTAAPCAAAGHRLPRVRRPPPSAQESGRGAAFARARADDARSAVPSVAPVWAARSSSRPGSFPRPTIRWNSSLPHTSVSGSLSGATLARRHVESGAKLEQAFARIEPRLRPRRGRSHLRSRGSRVTGSGGAAPRQRDDEAPRSGRAREDARVGQLPEVHPRAEDVAESAPSRSLASRSRACSRKIPRALSSV